MIKKLFAMLANPFKDKLSVALENRITYWKSDSTGELLVVHKYGTHFVHRYPILGIMVEEQVYGISKGFVINNDTPIRKSLGKSDVKKIVKEGKFKYLNKEELEKLNEKRKFVA